MSASQAQELQQAVAAYKAGKYVQALDAAERLLGRAPADVEALHLKAMTLGKLGRIDEAAAAFEDAARRHPNKAAVLANFGNALSSAGRSDEALAAYRRALAADPVFVQGWINLAAALRAKGEGREAEAALRKAVALNPRHATAHNNLGTLLNAAGRHDEALDAFDAALKADPNFVMALINRGAARRTRRDYSGALADLEKAAALAPNMAEAHRQLANTLRLAGRVDEAEAAFRRSIELEPASVSGHRDLAKMLWEAGRKADFLRALDEAILRTGAESLLDLKAELALFSDETDAGEAAARALAERFPRSGKGFAYLARARRNRGLVEEAAKFAQRAHALSPDDFTIRHEYAEYLLALGRADEAASLLVVDAPREHLQKHIALKALAQRVCGDSGYRYFYDYDRFARKLFIDPPPGFASVAAFNDALIEALKPLHADKSVRPLDQTLYGGTQSLGRLWDEPHPAIQALKSALLRAAGRYVHALPEEPAHPFLAAKTRDLVCAGAWSVVLSSGGGHVDHIHPKGWISASYYVRVPEEVTRSEKAGFLRLGASGVAGLDLPAERWIKPEEGGVVFFPSYIWHGVEPFESASPRVTAPFDLAPAFTPA